MTARASIARFSSEKSMAMLPIASDSKIGDRYRNWSANPLKTYQIVRSQLVQRAVWRDRLDLNLL